MKLRLKINLSIFLTFIVISGIFGAMLFPFELQRRARMIEQIELSLRSIVEQTKDDLADEIFGRQKSALKATLNDLMDVKGVIAIHAYNPDGSLFTSTDGAPVFYIRASERKTLENGDSFIEEVRQNQTVLTYTVNIQVIGESIGYLKMHYNLMEVEQAGQLNLTLFAAMLLTVLLLMYGLLNVLLARLVLRPVYVFQNSMQRIQKGYLGEQIDIQRKDEIGEMAQTFNRMSADLAKSYKQNMALTQMFEKFVPTQFLKTIAPEGIENIELGRAESGNITVLFSDIRSFTNLSETMTPQELLNFLNAYLKRMNEPIHANHGFIDKFVGDAIMALFDRPDGDDADEARDAVLAALAMQEALQVYNQSRRSRGYLPISIGIGIHSGYAIIGTVGSADRMDSTVLGDVVNLASRLEGLTKYYNSKIIISSQVNNLLGGQAILRRKLDFVNVKGKDKPVEIFEIYNNDEEPARERKQYISEPYHAGLSSYYSRHWDAALNLFQLCLQAYPEDVVSRMYVDRCLEYKKQPPAKDWNGSLQLTHK